LKDNLPFPEKTTLPIIACHTNPLPTKPCRNTQAVAMKALKILLSNSVTAQHRQCDIYIEPPKLDNIEQSIFIDFRKIIAIGYKYTDKLLSSL
jgi:hypothetical protein